MMLRLPIRKISSHQAVYRSIFPTKSLLRSLLCSLPSAFLISLLCACTLFLPNGSYTIFRQKPELEYLYTVPLYVTQPEGESSDEFYQISRAFISNQSDPSGLPLAFLELRSEKRYSQPGFFEIRPGNASPLIIPNFDRSETMFTDDQPGLLAFWRDPVSLLDGLYRFSAEIEPQLVASRPEVETNTSEFDISMAFIQGMLWHPPTQGGQAGYRILWNNGQDLIVQKAATANMAGNTHTRFENAADSIDGSFETLNNTNWPDTSFWNQAATRLYDFGFAPSGNVQWITANRSSGRGEAEIVLLSLDESNGTVNKIAMISKVAGRAGPYVLVQDTRSQNFKQENTYKFIAYNKDGTVSGGCTVYGHHVAYVGELSSPDGLKLVFASLVYYPRQAITDFDQPNMFISLFALPLASLEARR